MHPRSFLPGPRQCVQREVFPWMCWHRGGLSVWRRRSQLHPFPLQSASGLQCISYRDGRKRLRRRNRKRISGTYHRSRGYTHPRGRSICSRAQVACSSHDLCTFHNIFPCLSNRSYTDCPSIHGHQGDT